MRNQVLIPVILCGGSGSRLWPLSRESYPKQYLSINSNDKKSLLQKTHARIKDIEGIQNPILICNEEHRFIAAEQMRSIKVTPSSIILEPIGRNTAPAIALSALKAIEKDKNSNILVLSSDHEIKNQEKFLKAIKIGLNYSEQDKLVTFGVVPDSPETGFGYIKSKNEYNKMNVNGGEIIEFVEKPDSKKAKEFLKDKRFTWNSGMFLFKAETILNEINKFFPEIISLCKQSLLKSSYDLDFQRLNKEDFCNLPNISIDNAVLEKTDKGIVIPLDAGWSDIGSWNAVWNSAPKDNDGNFIEGKVILSETRNCLIKSDNRLIAGIGLENLVIVETNDAILVSDKNKTQDVKEIVNRLKNSNIPEGQTHRKIYRPWGDYTSVVDSSNWQVKLINVKPGEKLSLQMHHHRSEHWIVVSGTANVEIDERNFTLTGNQSTYIPLGSKHRLSNPGKINLVLIEVQSGSYLGEDDIIRFDDIYGRSN